MPRIARTLAVTLIAAVSLTAAGAGFAAGAGDTSADSPKELASAYARKAKKAEKQGHMTEAFLLYSQAAALQPANRTYRAGMQSLQASANSEQKGADSKTPDAGPALGDYFDSLTEAELAKARPLREVPTLHAKPGTQNFDLNADARTLFEKVAATFDIATVFDGDYPKTGTTIRFHVSGADYRDAFYDLECATGSFVIPLSGRLMMVAQDTPAKRNDLEQTMAISVPVPSVMTTQELTELAQVIRQTTNVEKIAWVSAQSSIVIRDRLSRVIPAVAILNQLISWRPEVMIDLEFLQIDHSNMLNYGFTVTNTFSAVYLGQILNNAVSAPSGVTNLFTFGAGKTLIGLSAAQVQAMFNQTLSDSSSIYSAQLRSLAGQAASLHVGERYPVITSAYVGNSSTTNTGTTGISTLATVPSFTYQDLGLTLKVTPFINGEDTTTLAVETTFAVLSGQAVNGIPIIGNRSMKSQVSLRNGEWAVIGALENPTHSKTVGGFWGLAQIPLLGNLFKQVSTDDEESDVLIGIRPRLLSLPAGEGAVRTLRVGSDTRPFTPL